MVIAAAAAMAQDFDDYFVDRTLRLDYVFAGNNHEQHIYFEQEGKRPVGCQGP